MTRFNFKEACLLDASGELGPAARQSLATYLRENPAARHEYHEIRKSLEILRHLPNESLDGSTYAQVPVQLKASLQASFLRQKQQKQAVARRRLVRAALAGISSAAAMVLIAATLAGKSAENRWAARDRDQAARLDQALARFAPPKDSSASSYDQMVTDVEASLRQLQTESPTLAQLHDRNMARLLDALSSVSQDWDDFATSEPPAPPAAVRHDP